MKKVLLILLALNALQSADVVTVDPAGVTTIVGTAPFTAPGAGEVKIGGGEIRTAGNATVGGTLNASSVIINGNSPGQAGGLAILDSQGKIPGSQLPIASYGHVLRTTSLPWVVPAGVTRVKVVAIGGGGGGGGGANGDDGTSGGAGSGGASGRTAVLTFDVTPGDSFTVSIGTGGAGTAATTSTTPPQPSDGGATTVTLGSITLTAPGGKGGRTGVRYQGIGTPQPGGAGSTTSGAGGNGGNGTNTASNPGPSTNGAKGGSESGFFIPGVGGLRGNNATGDVGGGGGGGGVPYAPDWLPPYTATGGNGGHGGRYDANVHGASGTSGAFGGGGGGGGGGSKGGGTRLGGNGANGGDGAVLFMW